MPAIQVARTDTFEQQRVKINEISDALFSVTSGGSDLSTGNLQLGDGTIAAPSLAFISDNSLGIYKVETSTLGFVASGKKIFDVSLSDITTYQDIIVQQRKLLQSGLNLADGGSNYDPGEYTALAIVGGSGQNATLDVNVTAWDSTITNLGSGYLAGGFTSVPLVGGSGNGATANFTVDGIVGTIDNAGSAYVPGTYTAVPLTGGSGSGAEATIEITGDAAISGSITTAGSGYVDSNYPFVQIFNVPTQTFVVTSIANPNAGQPGEPNYIYQIDGNTQPLLTVEVGNTYRFDMSDATLDPSGGTDPGANHRMTFQMADGSGIDPEFEFYVKGDAGTTGAFIDLIIKPTGVTGSNVIRYDCANHPGMAPAGGNMTVNSGTLGNYGSQAFGDVTISGGAVTNVTFVANGSGYRAGDTLEFSNLDVGGVGSGFEYTVSGITYTGTVQTVTITNNGTGYATNDTLSFADASVGGGGGSGFAFLVTSNPGIIQGFAPVERGTGYQIGDVLGLGQGVSGNSGYAPGSIGPFSTTLGAGTTFTISSVANLQVGMYAATGAGDTGSLDPSCVIQSLNPATNEVTVSIAPLAPGAANITFTSVDLFSITVADTTGMNIDDIIVQTGGAGVFAAGTTVANVVDATTLTLSQSATTAGPVTFDVLPPYGNPADDFQIQINNLGVVDTVTVNAVGNGYAVGDQLTINPSDLTQPISLPVTAKYVQTVTFVETIASGWVVAGDLIKQTDGAVTGVNQTTAPDVTQTITGPVAATTVAGNAQVTVASTTGISVGDIISEDSSGNIPVDPTVISIDSPTQITMSAAALQSASINLTFVSDEAGTFSGVAATGGSGSNVTFDVTRNTLGQVTSVSPANGGVGYAEADVLTIAGNLVGGTSPTHDIVLEVSGVTESTATEVISVEESGGNITSILVETDQGNPYDTTQTIIKDGTSTPVYTIDVAGSISVRFYIDPDGNGPQLTPNLTLYVGSTYRFDTSDNSMSGTQFALSKFPDGFHSPSRVENVNATLDITSRVLTVANTTGMVPGMIVVKVSGDGELESDTRIESVDSSTQITLTQTPTVAGAIILNVTGDQFTEGVESGQGFIDLSVTEATPSLYYYDNGILENGGGADGSEAVITIDSNNPKVFGSGLLVTVTTIQEADVITSDVIEGTFTAQKVVSPLGEIDVITGASVSVATVAATTSVTTAEVASQSDLAITANNAIFSNDITVGLFSVTNASGNVLTSGEIQTLNRLNVSDTLFITGNTIETDPGSDLLLTAPTGRLTKVTGFGALTIPSGNTQERPSGAENGSIRFNTQTNQYEGYSSGTASWSSLGGVRDLDGNTYITAEETIGSNDNTLWFYNDNVNTIRVTPQELEFVGIKKLTSVNTGAPAFLDWAANTPVTLGQYLKFKNNLYEVTVAGTTGSSGSEPTHTSGAVLNGTAELTWSQLAVAPLTFDDIEVVRIGPNSGIPLSINNDLRLTGNVLSTDISDLTLRPNAGKKVVVDCPTSLVLPTGADADRGIAVQGSIRFSQTTTQFEGYDGTNWGSLGGVKDVDQNTYIIPETSPGANENILYFYNDNNNTLQVTGSALDFYSIDTIRSVTSNELEITAELLTFNQGTSTFDNTDPSRTFLHTTRQYLDLGLSAGLTIDPVLRLDDQGDVYLNTGFGTGTFNGVKVLDGELKEFELADIKILTEKINLIKGTADNGSSELYASATNTGCKTTVIAENTNTGDREFIEFGIVDDGTDVFHTEYGNIRTGVQLIVPTFEVTGTGVARINIELGADVATTESVNITVVSNITKK